MKKLIALLLMVTIVSCKKKDEPQPEPAPTTTGSIAPTTKVIKLQIQSSASGTLNLNWDWDYNNQVMGSKFVCSTVNQLYDFNNTIGVSVDSMKLYFFTYTTTPVINYTLSVNNAMVTSGVINDVSAKYLKY